MGKMQAVYSRKDTNSSQALCFPHEIAQSTPALGVMNHMLLVKQKTYGSSPSIGIGAPVPQSLTCSRMCMHTPWIAITRGFPSSYFPQWGLIVIPCNPTPARTRLLSCSCSSLAQWQNGRNAVMLPWCIRNWWARKGP